MRQYISVLLELYAHVSIPDVAKILSNLSLSTAHSDISQIRELLEANSKTRKANYQVSKM